MAAAADVGLLPALKPVLTDALEAIRWAVLPVAVDDPLAIVGPV